jgi:hypothetical protein
METTGSLEYYRGRWPEPTVPKGEPEWSFYEISREQDAVLRAVDLYPDGKVTRNSIEIEQRHGDECPSLIDCSLNEGFAGADLITIDRGEFEQFWNRGTDVPFWFVR